jgi:transketolase
MSQETSEISSPPEGASGELSDWAEFARQIRVEAVRMVHAARASHIGGALSMADILAVLYSGILHVRPEEPQWGDRDRMILSKGHCCTTLYATLALKGFFPLEELRSYGQDGSRLMAHISHKVPGVEFSTGSLGHGLPFGCGKALAAKRKGVDWRTFVMLSDGELDEGSNWEAILFAPQRGLDNLVAIVDYNKIQSLGSVSEVLELAPLADKLRAFRWAVREVDGHDHAQIGAALSTVPWETSRPSCLIAHTIKGRGVSFMENQLAWHYKSPDPEQLRRALLEIESPGSPRPPAP